MDMMTLTWLVLKIVMIVVVVWFTLYVGFKFFMTELGMLIGNLLPIGFFILLLYLGLHYRAI